MKKEHLLLMLAMLMLTGLTTIAQNVVDKANSQKENIPFGKKLPEPDLINSPGNSSQQMMPPNLNKLLMQAIKTHDKNAIKKALNDYRQQLKNQRIGESLPLQRNNANANSNQASANSDFHLTKDINALAESNPENHTGLNYPDDAVNNSYAILDHVMYFAADDGIHGEELWRSDGTAPGTFMVKDVEPGATSSNPADITEANGKLYFAASTLAYGQEPWVSDGTENGTQLLMDIFPGNGNSLPTEFTALGNKTYFAAGVNDYLDALWETDGTPTGTKMIKSLAFDPGGFLISQMVEANGLLFFTFISYTTGGLELWRSDGTDGGTYHIGTNTLFYNFPVQLTNYNNKLYFSADDGTGNKLWVTDGTDAGTTPAPGNNDVLIDADGNFGTPFPVIDNVLYIPGSSTSGVHGLYKYNATNTDGITLVKNLSADADIISSTNMKVVNNTLYFKVTNYISNIHDELWSSNGTEASTKLVNKFSSDETINDLYSGNNHLYFVKHDKLLGTELWTIFDTPFGRFPILVRDIFSGATGSYPHYLTAFKDKLFFAATDELKGNELFMTNSLGIVYGATLVKDINTVSTSSSYAGYYVNGITPLGSKVLFNAFEKAHGRELYTSDGTASGTFLLNDIVPGETWSNPGDIITKNNFAYFIAASSDSTNSIFKTDGTKSGLKKVVPDYNSTTFPYYRPQYFKVADNGIVFYALLNQSTYTAELWRSDGTAAGTYLLSSALPYSNNLNVVGNTAFFVGVDAINGNELWKSDGSIAGTKMVKDINPGVNGSYPAGMAIYKNEVYFAADNGAGPSFWKSDGTKSGTIQLRQIDPWYSGVFSTERYYFEVSNNILYFSAINYANSKGTQLWRTDGTVAGTQSVKDISPNADSYYPVPFYFKDVKGTLFFIGDDGVHGTELWKSDGTKDGTQMVKDITPGIDPSSLNYLTSFAGKLYFTNSGALWSSDGTADGTMPVDDAVINNVYVYNMVPANDQLFLSGSTQQYGFELYAGKADETGKFVASKVENASKTTLSFNAVLYPNPVVSNAALQITGNTKNISVNILDMSGKKLWQSNNINATLIKLPVEKYTSGTYLVTVTNGTESKTIKLVKQ